MRKFIYRGVNKDDNRTVGGVIEAETKEEAAEILLDQGVIILDLRDIGLNLEFIQEINIGGIPSKDKMFFMRQLSFMVGSGISLVQALELTVRQIGNKGFRSKMLKVTKEVQSGIPLSKSLENQKELFDKVTVNLIKAGEESGKLELILDRIADNMEKQEEFKSKLQGALIYPIIVVIAIIGVVAALMVFMVPEMSKLYADQGAKLPWVTQVMINISNFLASGPGGVALMGFILISVLSFLYYRSTPSGRLVTDKLLLKLPVFGELVKKGNVAEFSNTLALLLSAGVPIVDALDLVSQSVSNSFIQEQLIDVKNKVEKGVPLSLLILNNTEAFPELLGHMIRIGEETGKIDEIVSKLGKQYSKEVENMASNINKLLEPLILIVMGLVVGGLAVAVYLPIMNLGSVIAGG